VLRARSPSGDRHAWAGAVGGKAPGQPAAAAPAAAGPCPRAFALLQTTGRRTGRRRLTPAGNGLDGDVFRLITGCGRRCSYVANVSQARGAGSRRASASVPASPGSPEMTTRLPAGPSGSGQRAHRPPRRTGVRATATTPVTIRIDLEPPHLPACRPLSQDNRRASRSFAHDLPTIAGALATATRVAANRRGPGRV
jgi:hypothetical protein